MSLIADALLPQMVAGLTAVKGRVETGAFTELLTSPRSAYEVDFDDPNKAVRIEFRASDAIATALASDCCRLSTSAIQSLSNIEAEIGDKTLMPWALVKLYYSAFYSGNTLIRMVGAGCAFLDKSHIKRLVDVGAIYGNVPNFQLERGLYRLTINAAATQLACVRLGSATGGTHELFWAEFVRAVRGLSPKVLASGLPAIDAQSVIAKLTDLDRQFAKRGSSWLSRTRNDVQYRHAYEVWYKCGIKKRDRDTLSRLAGKWNSDPMQINLHLDDGDLGDFIKTCTFITAICNAIVKNLSQMGNGRSKSFIHFGPTAYLNEFSGA